MEVITVDANSYDETFMRSYHKFNKAVFNSLNSHKCERVIYLLFKDTKVRAGIIFGVNDGTLLSPFSAPFGGFQYFSKDITISQIDNILVAVEGWAVSMKFIDLKIILPPVFYNTNFITKLTNSFLRANYQIQNLDINYQFPTAFLDDDYMNKIWHNAKKNLKRSLNYDLNFEKLDPKQGEIAYAIIAENRKQRGFPLKMSWKDLKVTGELISADFFIVSKDKLPIASAIIFSVAEDIVQVIYWGDLPEYSNFKTMNFLSYHVFKYYKEQGIRYVDIGPSTENTIPNHGLCEFKESIGCELNPKFSFYKKLL